MRRRRFRHTRKSMYISLVILFFVFISVGYSYLSKQLNISGNITLNKASWNVHFENVQVENGSAAADNPVIDSNTSTSIIFSPKLNELGDYYEFTVDVVNSGLIDAMLSVFPTDVLTLEQQKYLELSITYDDGVLLKKKDQLKIKQRDTIRIKIAYKKEDEIPNDAMLIPGKLELTLQLIYIQDDGTSKEREYYGAGKLLLKTNTSNATYNTVNEIKQKEMFIFEHDATEQTSALTDYRYIGNAGENGPNNYIKFNCITPSDLTTCEDWRIIGVFDGHIKIIRNDKIENTNLKWDHKTSLGSSVAYNGSNDWSDAQLMYMLNKEDIEKVLTAKPNYTKSGDLIKDTNNKIIYRLGYLPSQQTRDSTSYSGTAKSTWYLNNSALDKVEDTKYYLGGSPTESQSVEIYYINERGSAVYQSSYPIQWEGKVGLMYPSDYGYTYGKGVDEICENNLYKCYRSDGGNPNNSWLYAKTSEWTISPKSNNYYVSYIFGDGRIGYYTADTTGIVRPVVYLKSNIHLLGIGSKDNPYRIMY